MSHPNPRHGTILPLDTDFDDNDQSGVAQPISQTEIEDLLYNDERPVEERIARLREMRDETHARSSADIGGGDTRGLLRELDSALETLISDEEQADENADYAGLAGAYENDPADHLDSLSPDDEDGRHAIEGDDEDNTDEEYVEDLEKLDAAVIDEDAWDEDKDRSDR